VLTRTELLDEEKRRIRASEAAVNSWFWGSRGCRLPGIAVFHPVFPVDMAPKVL
jgi:hypothetical protein